MRELTRCKGLVTLLFALISLLAAIESFAFTNDTFPITLAGTVMSPDDRTDMKTFELWVPEEKWFFRVTDVTATGPGVTNGWMLLNRVSPRRIKLVGNEETLRPLHQSEVVGKTLRLTGTLYMMNKMLKLSLVEEIVGQDPE
jgi:hypothetical protein